MGSWIAPKKKTIMETVQRPNKKEGGERIKNKKELEISHNSRALFITLCPGFS